LTGNELGKKKEILFYSRESLPKKDRRIAVFRLQVFVKLPFGELVHYLLYFLGLAAFANQNGFALLNHNYIVETNHSNQTIGR
jgi:hypothetical protein